MNIFLSNFLSLLAIFIIIHTAYAIGIFLIEKLKIGERVNFFFLAGSAVTAGFGVLAISFLIISFFLPLYTPILCILILIILFFGRGNLKELYEYIFYSIKKSKKRDFLEKTLLLFIFFCFLFYLSSALTPPYRTDALSYHLPEAMGVAEQGFSYVWQNSVKGAFYIYLPMILEVLYAGMFKLGGFTLIHLSHYTLVLAGLLTIYGFLENYFGKKKALFSVLFIFTLYEFFVNATNSYVDAGMAVFEISGLLWLLSWIVNKKQTALLILSGFFYGLALSVKYNAVYGCLIAGILFLCSSFKERHSLKRIFRNSLFFAASAILIACFWYVKNCILAGNPIYPFYFGHNGYSEAEYEALSNAVKSFTVARSFMNFLFLPFVFFLKPYYLAVFASFFAWPLSFLWVKAKENKIILRYASLYIVFYLFVWFFFGTHQYKFFFVPAILLLAVFGLNAEVVLGWILKKANPKFVLVVVLLLAVCFGYKVMSAKNNYFVQVKKADLYYNFGIEDKIGFYDRKNLGEVYRVSDYINENFSDEKFFDVWGATNFFLRNGNRFFSDSGYMLSAELIEEKSLRAYLEENGIKYAIIDNNDRERTFADPLLNTLSTNKYLLKGDEIHKLVEKIGEEIYNKDGVVLYEL